MNADETDDTLPPIGRATLDPPPPSAALLERVGVMRPVEPRSRFGAFLAVLLLGLVWPAFTLLHGPLRPDLGALPLCWVLAGAAIWGAALLTTLAAALVPRRGDVLPSAPQASRTAVIALLVLLAFSALGTVSVPGVSLRPEDLQRTLLESCLACGSYVLGVAGLVLALAVFALRGALPMGGARIGIALGTAGAAAGGLALHFHCPIAVPAHVALGHAVPALLAALAGALLVPRLAER